MKITEALRVRRTYYAINRELPVSIDRVIDMTKELTELVPDAYNMKSSRVVVVYGEKQDQLWNRIYDVFEGKIARDKIDSFRAGSGTILYFYDRKVVENFQKQFPRYAELNIGASLQHYNPVIDKAVKELFNLPEEYVLVAEMPFGGIVEEPAPKDKEDITKRVFSVC